MLLAVREDTNHGGRKSSSRPKQRVVERSFTEMTILRDYLDFYHCISHINLTLAESPEANSSFAEDLQHWQD